MDFTRCLLIWRSDNDRNDLNSVLYYSPLECAQQRTAKPKDIHRLTQEGQFVVLRSVPLGGWLALADWPIIIIVPPPYSVRSGRDWRVTFSIYLCSSPENNVKCDC